MNLITVFIAEAHVPLRQRLSRFLAQQPDMQVIGEAADGRQVLSQVEACQPHLLVLDVQMPKLGGLAALPSIRANSPRTKILIRVDFFEEEFIARVLQHGAHGCVLKTAPQPELVKAIRTAHAGELWAPRKVLTRVVESLRQRMDELEGSFAEIRDILSDREQEVVIWAVQGMTNKAIAAQLGISEKTVKTHLQKVFRKLNVSRRVQLPCFLLPPTPPTFPASRPGPLRRDSRM